MLLHNFAESVRILQKQEQQIIVLCVPLQVNLPAGVFLLVCAGLDSYNLYMFANIY